MEAMPWSWIWSGLSAVLYVAEMLTLSFFILPFALGATVAAVAGFAGAALWLQWVLFAAVSVLALVFIRPAAKKLTSKAQPAKSGVDRLVGTTGQIIEGQAPTGENRAIVEREVWNVSTANGEQLPLDTTVKVLRVDGAHLIVERV